MIEVKEALPEQYMEIKLAMLNVSVPNLFKVWGMWENGKCIGGSCISTDFFCQYGIGFTAKPSQKLGFAIYQMACMALEYRKPIYAKVEITNLKSRKGAKQLGFKHLRFEGGNEILELTDVPKKMHKRWAKYVSDLP